MEKILISACLLGINVRYNAQPKAFIHHQLTQWKKQGRLISVCPEVVGGLSTPRPPAEISPYSGKVITQQGIDVSYEFAQGAQHALTLCKTHNIKFALLKESSPSCGSNTIYNGSFQQQKIQGLGITAKLLIAHGIHVYSEETFTHLIAHLNKKHAM